MLETQDLLELREGFRVLLVDLGTELDGPGEGITGGGLEQIA